MSGTQLHPQFLSQLAEVLSDPSYMVDLTMRLHFPERAANFERWIKMQLRQPNFSDVYVKLHELFPDSLPMTEGDTDAGFMFREMLKCITAEAYGFPYTAPTRIITKLN